MIINGISVDIEDLEKAYAEYKKQLLKLQTRCTYTMSADFRNAEEARLDFNALGLHIPEYAVDYVFKESTLSTYEKTAEYLEDLVDSTGINTNKIQKMSGLDCSIIRKVINNPKNKKKHALPKTTLMALCLIFQMPEDEVNIAFENTGHILEKSLPETTFKSYIKSHNYALKDFVDDVNKLAEAANKNMSNPKNYIQLPEFYSGNYENVNIQRKWNSFGELINNI